MLDRLKMNGHAMRIRMAQMEAITNNLANVNTNGFKRDDLFVNELQKRIKEIEFPHSGINTHVPNSGTRIDFSQGALVETKQPLDVAISGNGLFAVETPQGEAYSRDGRFTLNNEGILSTVDGHLVLGEGGPIEVDLQSNKITDVVINDQGELLVNGSVIDNLKIVAVDDPLNFTKIGSNLYQRRDDSPAPGPADGVSVRQGYLEASNANPINEMVAMMEVFHFFQTSQKMIQAQDSILQHAVNSIGRVAG